MSELGAVNVLFFASLRELYGQSQVSFETELPCTAEALRERLAAGQSEQVKSGLCHEDVKLALNQEHADWSALVNSGDELALFPPVTGG